EATAVAMGRTSAPVNLPAGRAWLVVVGSVHPGTRAQLHRLERAGVTAAGLPPPRGAPPVGPVVGRGPARQPPLVATDDAVLAEPGARARVAARLGDLAARVLAESVPDLVMVTGGDTAVALLRAVNATRIELVGAPARGLALGSVVVGTTRTFPVLTK